MPNSKHWYQQKRWIIPIIVIVLLTLIIVATPPAKNNTPVVGNQPQTNTNTTKTEDKSKFAIGETYDNSGKLTKIISVERDTKCGYSPDPSLEFVKVNIELENKSKQTMTYNGLFDWKLMDATGDSKSPAFCSELDSKAGKLNSGQLAINGKKTGYLVFSVPKNSKPLVVLYASNVLSSDSIQFNLD